MPNGTRQVPCDAVISAFGGNGYGDVLQLSPTERNQSHSAATTHQMVRHYGSEDQSGEEGEEEGDLLSQEPFPSESVVFHEYPPR